MFLVCLLPISVRVVSSALFLQTRLFHVRREHTVQEIQVLQNHVVLGPIPLRCKGPLYSRARHVPSALQGRGRQPLAVPPRTGCAPIVLESLESRRTSLLVLRANGFATADITAIIATRVQLIIGASLDWPTDVQITAFRPKVLSTRARVRVSLDIMRSIRCCQTSSLGTMISTNHA